MDATNSRTFNTDQARVGRDSTSDLESHEIKRFAPLVFEDSQRWTGAFESMPNDARRHVLLGLVPPREFTVNPFDITPCLVSCAPVLATIAAFGRSCKSAYHLVCALRKDHALSKFRYHASLFEFRLYGIKTKPSAQFARERSIIRYDIDPVITAGSFLPQRASVHEEFTNQELARISPETLEKRLPRKSTHAVIVHEMSRSNVDGMLKLLRHCSPSLQELEVKSIVPNFDQDELAEGIRACDNLSVLSIGNLGDASGAAVQSLIKLQSLEVLHTRMDGERFAFIAKASSSRQLKCLSVLDPLDTSGLHALVQHATGFQCLTDLRLDRGKNGFETEHAPYFLEILTSLPSLESLTVSGCDQSCATAIAQAVADHGKIKSLKFDRSKLEPRESCEALIKLQSCLGLESLVLDWAADESGMTALHTLLSAAGVRLRNLELDLTFVPASGVQKLAQALQVNRSLHTLSLIEESGLKGLATATALGCAIGANTTLRRVVLACSAHIGGYIRGAADSRTLLELDISNSSEDTRAEQAFLVALKANPDSRLMEVGFPTIKTHAHRLAIDDVLSINRRGKPTSATGTASS